MARKMRIMSERPLNAETPVASLQSWITSNAVFFKRNQGQIMAAPVSLDDWRLSIQGLVEQAVTLQFADILALPKVEVANTLECSGNSRSLLEKKASGNPWTIGGVGHPLLCGVLLSVVLAPAGVAPRAPPVGFLGLVKPLGQARFKFFFRLSP